MSTGNKPSLKISVKPRGGEGGRISVFAFWRRDGKLSGQLDRRVVALAMKMEDGSVITIKRGEDGKPTHFVDAFEEDAPRTTTPERPAAKFDSDPFAGDGEMGAADDLPFAPRKL